MSTAWYLLLAYVVGFWSYFLWTLSHLSPRKIREKTGDENLVLPVMAMGVLVAIVAAVMWPGAVILDIVGWYQKRKNGEA